MVTKHTEGLAPAEKAAQPRAGQRRRRTAPPRPAAAANRPHVRKCLQQGPVLQGQRASVRHRRSDTLFSASLKRTNPRILSPKLHFPS